MPSDLLEAQELRLSRGTHHGIKTVFKHHCLHCLSSAGHSTTETVVPI